MYIIIGGMPLAQSVYGLVRKGIRRQSIPYTPLAEPAYYVEEGTSLSFTGIPANIPVNRNLPFFPGLLDSNAGYLVVSADVTEGWYSLTAFGNG